MFLCSCITLAPGSDGVIEASEHVSYLTVAQPQGQPSHLTATGPAAGTVISHTATVISTQSMGTGGSETLDTGLGTTDSESASGIVCGTH